MCGIHQRKFFLFGSPIAKSASPAMHNAAFKAQGLTGWVYDRCETTDVGVALETIASPDFGGGSVTIPLKVLSDARLLFCVLPHKTGASWCRYSLTARLCMLARRRCYCRTWACSQTLRGESELSTPSRCAWPPMARGYLLGITRIGSPSTDLSSRCIPEICTPAYNSARAIGLLASFAPSWTDERV